MVHRMGKLTSRSVMTGALAAQVRILFPDQAKLGNGISEDFSVGIFAMTGSAKI